MHTPGAYEFWNWFDAESWHPLGRVVGGTVYPGLMLTAGVWGGLGCPPFPSFSSPHLSGKVPVGGVGWLWLVEAGECRAPGAVLLPSFPARALCVVCCVLCRQVLCTCSVVCAAGVAVQPAVLPHRFDVMKSDCVPP